MAQFFGLIPLNAANFESDNASAGHVLTADGAGGAAWQAAAGGAAGATDITYADLVSAINGASLTPGGFYRITDFVTRHYIVDANGTAYKSGDGAVTGPSEPLTVQAVAANQLGPLAWSALYPQDIIYYDWNPQNWLWDYSFGEGNGVDIIPGWKGVIVMRCDTVKGLSAPGDWRHCKTRRWKPAAPAWNSGTPYAARASCQYGTKIYMCLRSHTNQQPQATDSAYWIVVRDLSQHQFWNTSPASGWASGGGTTDGYQDFTLFPQDAQVSNISIAYALDNGYNWNNEPTMLPNTAFLHSYNYNVSIQAGCWFNTLGACSESSFGDLLRRNTFAGVRKSQVGGSCYNNTVGSGFNDNVVGVYFSGNFIGGNFSQNQIGFGFSSNVVGAFLRYSAIGANFSSNIVGPNCQYNDIGADITSNAVGADFKYHRVAARAMNSQDLLSATHVYNKSCEIFRRSDGSSRLRYTDASDVVQYAAVNA